MGDNIQFTQEQVDQIKTELANVFLQKYEALRNGATATEIEAESAEIKAARVERTKFQIMGLQAAASACGSSSEISNKIQELRKKIGGDTTPPAARAGARYGENPYSYEQLLIAAEAELEGLQMVPETRRPSSKMFGLHDRIKFLKGVIASGEPQNPRIRF